MTKPIYHFILWHATIKNNAFGKRKGEGIPLLVYGRDGEKEVREWWKRWRAEMTETRREGIAHRIVKEGFPSG
jgi:hypothetical protein